MPLVDWIFLAIVSLSVLVGAWRGLIYEMLSVMSWVAAFMLAQWFAIDAAVLLPMQGAGDSIRYAAGFLLVFIAVLFAGALLAFLVKKLVSAIGLRPVDRVLGALFGLVRGIVLLLAITWIVDLTPLHRTERWQQAQSPALLDAVLKGLKPMMPPEYGKYLPA
jgi:membrane protein required for colicin V production